MTTSQRLLFRASPRKHRYIAASHATKPSYRNDLYFQRVCALVLRLGQGKRLSKSEADYVNLFF